MTVPLKTCVRAIADLSKRERRMRVPHEAIKVVMGPLQKIAPEGFVVEAKELVV